MTKESFTTLFWQNFTSIKHGAEFFHVKPVTVRRWLDGRILINPMAEKLLLIKSLGFLPNDNRWTGFRIDEKRAVLICPDGRQLSPTELKEQALWRDEYKELVARYGHIEAPKITELQSTPHPFRGGRRNAAPWIPTKFRESK
ncbi:phage protein [Vibrio parahaemolyticus]|uniref:phage protein n=1 Tax=Vibrio harveyi group TaxID=717610 RepID=UPI00040C527F|nr:phage protein [Vibrio parahaemolyticus]